MSSGRAGDVVIACWYLDRNGPGARRPDVSRFFGVLTLALAAIAAACGGVEEPAADEGTRLERYGISVTPPSGWHARLTRATIEAATVAVPPTGHGVSLADADLIVRLFEYEPGPNFLAETERSHPEGLPGPFAAEEFGPPELGGDNPRGHGFARRNFSLAGRYFDLFVEAGAAKPPEDAVAELNALLASLEVRAGDYYPGTIEPPWFRPADGWHTASHGGGQVRAADYASAWASTVPYRNGPRDLPPADTLETLPADGILIWVGLARDNRFPPTAELRRRRPAVSVPLQVGQAQGGPGWEGQVGEISLYRLWGWVGEQYSVDLWIFFGRAEPSAEQRARAQALLDGLQLPSWGSWELDGLGESVGHNEKGDTSPSRSG